MSVFKRILDRSEWYRVNKLYHTDNRLFTVLQSRAILTNKVTKESKRMEWLLEAAKRNGVGYAGLPADWWIQLMNNIRDEAKIMPHAKDLDDALLDVANWLELSSLMIGLGFFETADIFRTKALNRAIGYSMYDKIRRIFYSDIILGAAIEEWDSDLILKTIRECRFLNGRCARNQNIQFLESLITGKDNSHSWHTGDVDYLKLIEGKTIAIIGPLTLGEQEKLEVNKYDFVVRLNLYDFTAVLKDDLRADIVYYANETIVNLSTYADEKAAYRPSAVVSRSPKYVEKLNDIRVKRSMPCTNPFTFNGGLNLLPRIIIDINRFRPASVKVFGADMYATTRYDKNYQGVQPENFLGFHDMFVRHDLITQYKATRLMHNKGMFVGDDRLEDVLALGRSKYLRLMGSKIS